MSSGINNLELYATLMENVSEIEAIDCQMERNVESLVIDEDAGFLRAYENYTFSSAAQVSNGNATQLQGGKVVSSNGIVPL